MMAHEAQNCFVSFSKKNKKVKEQSKLIWYLEEKDKEKQSDMKQLKHENRLFEVQKELKFYVYFFIFTSF